MERNINLVSLIKSATKENWWDTVKWLMYNIFGGLLPVYVTVLIIAIIPISFDFFAFFENGEFVIYSASLLSGACYLILKDKETPFVHRHLFGGVSLVAIVVATTIYAGLRLIRLYSPDDVGINKKALVISSTILFAISLVVSFLANFVDNIINSVDPTALKRTTQEKFETDFDKLGE